MHYLPFPHVVDGLALEQAGDEQLPEVLWDITQPARLAGLGGRGFVAGAALAAVREGEWSCLTGRCCRHPRRRPPFARVTWWSRAAIMGLLLPNQYRHVQMHVQKI